MQIPVITVGSIKGIQFTKTVIEKYNIADKLELILENDCIILKPAKTPRQGWEEAFKKGNENGNDESLINDVFEDENFEEWT